MMKHGGRGGIDTSWLLGGSNGAFVLTSEDVYDYLSLKLRCGEFHVTLGDFGGGGLGQNRRVGTSFESPHEQLHLALTIGNSPFS